MKSKVMINGSYTVEAALILPVIFLITVFVMQVSLFMCDEITAEGMITKEAEACAREMALGGLLNDYEEFSNILKKNIESKKDFLVAELVNVKVSTDYDNIVIEAELRLHNSVMRALTKKQKISIQVCHAKEKALLAAAVLKGLKR